MTIIELVLKMGSLLQYRNEKGLWHARAKGRSQFASGATPRIAMEAALALREEQSSPAQITLPLDDDDEL